LIVTIIMEKRELLDKFYTSFKNKDAAGMASCYHDDIIFHDPAFGTLKGEEAKAMWKMLLSKNDNELKINYTILEASETQGSVEWEGSYIYGPKRRKVTNQISAYFEFKEEKIFRHTDTFNIYKWSKQALGFKGTLLGWMPFFKKKIQQKTNRLLSKYMSN